MSRLEDIGAADGWRCWICDGPVDPEMSVNDPRGPSVDSLVTRSRSKGRGAAAPTRPERLAHRGCNTGKGAVAPTVPWAEHLFVVDPAPILAAAEQLERNHTRTVMARCPTQEDADAAADWLLDRMSRLRPEMALTSEVESGGGQFLVILRS